MSHPVTLQDAYDVACRALGEARVELALMEREIERAALVHAEMQAEIARLSDLVPRHRDDGGTADSM